MKKITALFFLFLIIYLNTNKIQSVFNDRSVLLSNKDYTITNFEPEINTKNINKYININDIKQINPYINPLYKEKIEHEFDKYIVNDNITDIVENYVYDYNNILKKYTFNKDNIEYQINGYPIESIIVNSIKNIKNLQYEFKITQ